MDDIQLAIREIAREVRHNSKRLTFAQRFFAGCELFDFAEAIATAGIKMKHPNFTDDQVNRELRRRSAIAEKLKERE